MGAALTGCSWDGYQHASLLGSVSTQIKILSDSPRVQELVSEGETLSKKLKQERLTHGSVLHLFEPDARQDELVRRLAGEPAFEAPGQSEFRILLESTCPCTDRVEVTVYYLKVEFTEGPAKGKVGWVCQDAIDDPRTRMP